MAETKKFYREAAASLVTHRLYAAPDRGNGFSDMHALASFLIGEDIWDLQIAQYADWLEMAVRAQYPDLPAKDVYEPDALRGLPAMLSFERPAEGIKGAGAIPTFIDWMNSERAKKDRQPIEVALVAVPDAQSVCTAPTGSAK